MGKRTAFQPLSSAVQILIVFFLTEVMTVHPDLPDIARDTVVLETERASATSAIVIFLLSALSLWNISIVFFHAFQ